MNELLIACRTCDSKKQRAYLTVQDLNQQKSEVLFSYYQCQDCQSLFLHPVPDNLGFYYGQNYPAYAVKNSPQLEKKLANFEQAKLDIVKRYAPRGTLLEIGPAAGRFLAVASHAGYDVRAIEQDAQCVKHIKDTLNLDVSCSDKPAEVLSSLGAVCDVIVAWHVIEHLQDLRGVMAAAAAALRKPEGVVIVSAPNPDSWSFRLFGRFWVHLDAPRHLALIPLSALDGLMAEQGLERVACVFDDPVGRFLSRMGWQASLMNLSSVKFVRWPLLAVIGRALSIVMRLPDLMQGRGAAYTAVYKHKRNV